MGREVCCGNTTNTGTVIMKILVTGATGFIGNHVLHSLLKFVDKSDSIIASSLNSEKANGKKWINFVEYISCDLSEDLDFYTIFNEPDCVIHLAWNGLPNYDGMFHIKENVKNDCRFLKNMMEHGVSRILVTGTCFEYGLQSGVLSEEIDTQPCTNYGRAKDSLREKVDNLLVTYPDVSFCWTRLFYMYGKGQNKDSFVSLLKDAIKKDDTIFNMSGGEQVRDFLPVEEMAENIVRLALVFNAKGVFNICSGTPMSLKALAEKFIVKEKSKITLNCGYYPYPDYEPMEFWGSPAKLHRALAYTTEKGQN